MCLIHHRRLLVRALKNEVALKKKGGGGGFALARETKPTAHKKLQFPSPPAGNETGEMGKFPL